MKDVTIHFQEPCSGAISMAAQGAIIHLHQLALHPIGKPVPNCRNLMTEHTQANCCNPDSANYFRHRSFITVVSFGCNYGTKQVTLIAFHTKTSSVYQPRTKQDKVSSVQTLADMMFTCVSTFRKKMRRNTPVRKQRSFFVVGCVNREI